MKFLISKNELVSIISKAQSVISPKPALPILANVLIEAQNDQLILTATDLTVSIRLFVDGAKVLEEGAITLPAKRFFQLVRELTSPQVEMHTSSPEIAVIDAGSSHFKVHGMHKGEFPTFPDMHDGASFTLTTGMLKDVLMRTAFAAARDDSRQVLNGIHLELSESQATFTSTDGKRLAKLQISVSPPSTPNGSSILPLKAMEELIRILENKDSTVKITLSADKAAFEIDNCTLVTKLLAGQYPDVSRVIPKKSEKPIKIHREELITLLRQVSLFTSESNSAVRFSLQPGSLHLSAMSGDIGEGRVNMPVNYIGPKLDIAFNPQFFLDILRHGKDEVVDFDVTDAYNPGLVTDSSNAEYVIMPMRLEN